MVDLISTITCWKNSTCETFLSSDREEVFDINAVMNCLCDSGLMIVELYYEQVKEETITVVLQKRTGIKFEEIVLTSEDFTYNERENKLYIDLSDYGIDNACSCEKLHKIIVQYTAGYEVLPRCLLPIFCDYLKYVIEMNRCQCNCTNCESDDEDNDITEPTNFEEYIQNSLFIAYKRQLETISLCGKTRTFVGVVV